jgi:hypothetical protein
MANKSVVDGLGQGLPQEYTEVSSGVYAPRTAPAPVSAATADVHAPDANTAAIVNYAAAGEGVSHVVSGVAWSYGGTGTLVAGNLKVSDGAGAVVFDMDITDKGWGVIVFPRPKRGTANTALTITLSAGGENVSGKVSALNHWLE